MDEDKQVHAFLIIGAMVVFAIGILCGGLVSNPDNTQDAVIALQHQRIIDSMQILNLKQRLLNRDTLVIHTTVVDGAIIKQRYCLGDSVTRIW